MEDNVREKAQEDFMPETEEVTNEEYTAGNEVKHLVSMDDYFLTNYRDYVVQELNSRLVDGEIESIVGVPVRSTRILPDECYFSKFSYWRLNKTDFRIDIDLRVELCVETEAGEDLDFVMFAAELWFSFCEEEESCEFSRLCRPEERTVHTGQVKLDPHLVPMLRQDEIDRCADETWMLYFAEALEDAKLRKPTTLAEKMHLSISCLQLYKQGNVRSTLYLQDDTALIRQEQEQGQKEELPPDEVDVPANTIVLNDDTEGFSDNDLDIYHECFHSEWHYLFFRLQNCVNSTIKKSRGKGSEVEDETDSIYFMEYQATYGSYALMMPKKFMIRTANKLYAESFAGKRQDGYYDHDGRRYDTVARCIAADYVLSKARVRARMIQLGYTAARGALNYVDGRYITPFSITDIGSFSGKDTYVISRKDIAKLYNQDEDFRRLMQTGKFAYVDGHVVYCDAEYAVQKPAGTRLSGWANAHVDRVSLRFSKEYIGNHKYTYSFGKMNNKEALENQFKFLDVNGTMTYREMQKASDRIMKEMPLSFHAALTYIMKTRVTIDELVRRIPISRATLLRLRKEERKAYKLDQVVAICIGLHLPPWLSGILLERAGLAVKRVGPFGYYGTILDCFFMDTIDEVQAFLKANKYKPLDLNFDEEG